MQNVLFITNAFPPFSRVGAIRGAKFARYLPEFGWRPIVLTCRRPSAYLDALDMTLASDLPSDLKLYEVDYPNVYPLYRLMGGRSRQGSFEHVNQKSYYKLRAFFVPDLYIGWYFTAVARALHIFRHHRIDLIYTTSPCETAHLIGMTLQRIYKRSWVADFRDPWIEKATRPRRAGILEKLDCDLQKKVVNTANRILVVTPGMTEQFKKVLPEVEFKLEVLTNGFDEQDFLNTKPYNFKCFSIVYAGSLDQRRDPKPVFQALSGLYARFPKLCEEVQIVLVGRQDPYVNRLIQVYQLEHSIRNLGPISHKECLQYVMGADILLLCIPEQEEKFSIPSKIYEYLRSGRPILAVASPNSDAIRIIKSAGHETCLVSRDPKAISEYILERLYHKTLTKQNGKQTSTVLNQFERKNLTARLAQVFDEELRRGSQMKGYTNDLMNGGHRR